MTIGGVFFTAVLLVLSSRFLTPLESTQFDRVHRSSPFIMNRAFAEVASAIPEAIRPLTNRDSRHSNRVKKIQSVAL